MSGKSGGGSKPPRRQGERPALTRVGVEAVQSKSGEVTRRATLEHYTGPLPPPAYLAEYEALHSGLANRIVSMAESQASHRRAMEASVVKANIEAQRQGGRSALIVSLAVLALAAYMAHLGMGGLSLAAVVANLTVLAGVFIGVKGKQQRELSKKQKQETEIPIPSKELQSDAEPSAPK